MYSNRVQNFASPAWLASNINANAKRNFQTNFTQPKSHVQAGNYHFPSKDVEEYRLGSPRVHVIGGHGQKPLKQHTSAEDDLDDNDPLSIKIREVIEEELNKPQSKIASLNLGITGLQYVFDSKQHIGCKLFWLTIIVCCFSVCSYQMIDRISMFLRYPVAAEIGVVQNQTVQFPVLVICPIETPQLLEVAKEFLALPENSNMNNTECFSDILPHLVGFKPKDKEILTAKAVWELTAPIKNNYFKTKTFQDLLITVDPVELKQQAVSLYLGDCARYELASNVEFHGIATQINYISAAPDKTAGACNRYAYKMMTVDVYDAIDMKSVVPVTAGAKVGFTVLVKQYEALDAPNNPCVSSQNYLACHTDCARDQMDKKIPCSLPYMSKSSKLPCTNKDDALSAHKIAEGILLELNVTRDCGCVRKCIRVMYSMLPKSYKFNTAETDVAVYYASNYFEIVKESYAYDWMSLLCDIGGNLGLYLGLSVLSIFEIIQSFFENYGGQAAANANANPNAAANRLGSNFNNKAIPMAHLGGQQALGSGHFSSQFGSGGGQNNRLAYGGGVRHGVW